MHAVASHIPDDYMNRRCRLSNVVERIIAVLAEQHKFLPHLPPARRLQHVHVAEATHEHDATEALHAMQHDAPAQQVAHVHVPRLEARHSHNHLSLAVRALLADDRQTEDGGDSVFFVSAGVPKDFSLEASKAPVLFHQKWCFLGCLLVLAWGETTNRTMADGREWYSCRTIRCGSGSWQDCGAGLWNRRQAHGVLAVQRQYSFRRQPEVTQRGKGVTTQTCFLPRGRRAQARSVGEGTSPCQANLGVFHGRLLRRGVRAKGAGPSGRNKPAGFPLTFCFVCRDFHRSLRYDVGWKGFKEEN